MIEGCPECGHPKLPHDLADRCLRCWSAVHDDLHHVFGRDAGGRYVQPEVLVRLCQPKCHQAGVHRVLTSQLLEGPMEATPGVIVGRAAVNLGWLAWDRPSTIILPGAFLADIADVLGETSRRLRQAEEMKL